MAFGPRDGILLVAHGTVSDLDDLPAFLERVRHGRPPSAELVAELRHRYETIGGSPLLEATREQATALARFLGVPVLVGMRLWHPLVEASLTSAANLGLSRLAVVPVAPFSVHVYFEAALRARAAVLNELGERTPEIVAVEPFGTEPDLVSAHVERLAPLVTGSQRADTTLVLTAHSLPTRVIEAGDPYAKLVEDSARAIGARLDVSYELAYQSQGKDGGSWLGPDLKSVLERVAREKRRVVVAPFGLLVEHVETLYDLDVEARGWSEQLGLEFFRAPTLGSHPGLVKALATVAQRALGSDPNDTA